jgi:ADP-ribose pyrophosphatase YjhB (NUDIX family)
MEKSTYSIRDLYEKRIVSDEEKNYLADYDINKYFRPSVSTDIAALTIKNKNEENYRKEEVASLLILMVKRGTHPFKDYWALPGGFLRENESIEECAYREIFEETNIKPISMKHIGVFSETGRDPRGSIVSNAFTSIIYDSEGEIVSGDDAEDARWFEVRFSEEEKGIFRLVLSSNEDTIECVLHRTACSFGKPEFETVSNTGIAFDHAKIIATALAVLKFEADKMDVVFDFLPERFTLAELQKVQETLLGKALLSANFRRKIADLVTETDEYTEGVGHRPARLFRRRELG